MSPGIFSEFMYLLLPKSSSIIFSWIVFFWFFDITAIIDLFGNLIFYVLYDVGDLDWSVCSLYFILFH